MQNYSNMYYSTYKKNMDLHDAIEEERYKMNHK